MADMCRLYELRTKNECCYQENLEQMITLDERERERTLSILSGFLRESVKLNWGVISARGQEVSYRFL